MCNINSLGVCTLITLMFCNGNFETTENQKGNNTTCNATTHFICLNGDCIKSELYCDGKIDCTDGSDEELFSWLSSVGSIPCVNSLTYNASTYPRTCALSNEWICDGVKGQCVHDKDELCWRDASRRCIVHETLQCNGYKDCEDGSDEVNCTTYQCASDNTTVLEGQLCNGRVDCPDGEDECLEECFFRCDFCPTGNSYYKDEFNVIHSHIQQDRCLECYTLLYFSHPQRYSINQLCDKTLTCQGHPTDELICDQKYICKNGNKINHQLRCEGNDDCGDGSDECDECTGKFLCNNGNCINMKQTCDWTNDCGDNSDECLNNCNSKFKFICGDGKCIATSSYCNGIIDCSDGSDELVANNHTNNHTSDDIIECKNVLNNVEKTCILTQKEWVCDTSDHCQDRTDECQPGCKVSFWCDHGKTCIKIEHFCNGVTECADGMDELPYIPGNNNTDVVPCTSLSGSRCGLSVTNPWICDVATQCLGGTDECVSGCNRLYTCNNGACIDREALCDGYPDCSDGSDEVVTHGDRFKCVRTRHPVTHTCVLPLSITNDGVSDCDRDMDIFSDRQMAGTGIGDNGNEMENEESHGDHLHPTSSYFSCIGENLVIPEEKHCDGKLDCPLLSDECMCQKSPAICNSICYGSVLSVGGDKEPCKKCETGQILCDEKCLNRTKICDGTIDCESGQDEHNCPNTTFCSMGSNYNCQPNFPCLESNGEIGHKTHAYICDGLPQCTYFEDECNRICEAGNLMPEYCNYVIKLEINSHQNYFSCNRDTTLLSGPKVCDGYSMDCPGGEDELLCPNRVYCNSTVSNETLKVQGGQIHIAPSQICDGRIDCKNKGDEANCEDYFYCDKGKPYFVPIKMVMDGKSDCLDGSDECPPDSFTDSIFASREHMIKNPFLRVIIWVMGTISVTANMVVLIEYTHGIYSANGFKKKRPFGKVNHVLVINLALADFLMGIYLILLGSESILMEGAYCSEDKAWRTSKTCNALGVISVLSTTTSVMILLIMTSYRLYGILYPFKSQHSKYVNAMWFSFCAWILSATLALVPLAWFISSFYNSHIWIKHNPYFTNDVVSQEDVISFVNRVPLFYGHDEEMGLHEKWNKKDFDMSWALVSSMMKETFGPDTFRGEFGYYSSHSVCIPKLFVTPEDKGWGHSLIIISFNFGACIYIVGAYTLIFVRNSSTLKMNNNRQNKMFRRIMYLAASDVICWVPICVMAFINLAGHPIPENAYAISAVILLPINSAVNPLLYSDSVQHIMLKILTCGKRSLTTAGVQRPVPGHDPLTPKSSFPLLRRKTSSLKCSSPEKTQQTILNHKN